MQTKNIEYGLENKTIINKDKYNYCNHFPILRLLGVNHHLALLHMYNFFVYLHDVEELINYIVL